MYANIKRIEMDKCLEAKNIGLNLIDTAKSAIFLKKNRAPKGALFRL